MWRRWMGEAVWRKVTERERYPDFSHRGSGPQPKEQPKQFNRKDRRERKDQHVGLYVRIVRHSSLMRSHSVFGDLHRNLNRLERPG